MFEVFDTRDGETRFTTRFEWLARFVAVAVTCWTGKLWDYTKEGEGW